ncbi:flagellar hook-length control protein FliK [Paenibacillus sp. 19GGS1-52]|uniref:flagellar hook-length control protein FliK n=1 Tax=Paenibacillus sp. 19GGS1-52 TaxID=2758563 RepID=UPI001EFB7B68|nr:flagellar hook-length control protein FliK [Paenibacillus sp. 19GGS1-52]ULO09705.1 flagellar hook-length control protein FliK [Paenibacillus sp. 19GGS1-52]
MSLVVQSNSSGNALTANGTTSASASNGAAVVLPFAQTLVQTMGENTAQKQAAPLLGNLASLLQGLLNAVQPTGKESEESVPKSTDLAAGLKEDIDKLDDSISADPTLLVALQSWLLQVSALLSGSSTSKTVTTTGAEAGSEVATKGGIETAGSLSPLAQNPATIRFAVQDDLNSLVNLVQQAVVSGNTESAAKGINLLNNFTALLEQVSTADNTNKVTASNVVVNSGGILEQPAVTKNKVNNKTTSSDVVVNSGVVFDQPTGTEAKVDSKDKIAKAIPTWINRLEDILAPKKETSATATVATSTTVEADSEISNIPVLKVIVAEEVKKTNAAKDYLPEVKIVSKDPEVVTVGQLSLRGGITAPLKSEVPPVPIQRFVQEMTGLITGKLGIVNKGGIAEATISLFPENLGQVDVKITMQNGNLVAQFLTQNSTTKDMLDQQMTQLRTALQSQGLQVEKLEVTQNNTPLQSQFGQEGRQPGSGGQQTDSRAKKSRGDSKDAIHAAELNSEWKEWTANAVQSERNQGETFSAKA